MSNIHGLSQRDEEAGGTAKGERGLLDYDDVPLKDPREESYFEMLRLTLCPRLTLTSFVVIIVIIDALIFVAQVFVDKIVNEGRFLEVNAEGKIIFNFGCYHKAIRHEFQYYRLFTSLFLHATFNHVFNNCVSTIIWGSIVEKLIGRNQTAAIYFLSGNLFSMIFAKPYQLGVGASTSIFCFFGVFIGFLILNWQRFEKHGYHVGRVVFNIFVILFLNVYMLSSDRGVDNYAHGGGFIAGIFLSMALADLSEGDKVDHTVYEIRVKKLGWLCTTVFTVGCTLAYLMRK